MGLESRDPRASRSTTDHAARAKRHIETHIICRISLETVSYTHLDVYKRQL